MTYINLGEFQYKDFKISLTGETGHYTNQVEARAELCKTEEEIEKEREASIEVCGEEIVEPTNLVKETINVQKNIRRTFLLGRCTVSALEDAKKEARKEIKDEIDVYWRDEAGEETRKKRKKV